MKKKRLESWEEVLTVLNDLEERLHKLQTTSYVPFATCDFDAAMRRAMRGLCAAHGVATQKVDSRLQREIRRALAAQRAKGMPELVGHLPSRLRPEAADRLRATTCRVAGTKGKIPAVRRS